MLDPVTPNQPQQQPNQSQPSGFGDLAAALASSTAPNQQQPSPVVSSPSPTPQPQRQAQPPQVSVPRPVPILGQLIAGLIHPRSVSMDQARPVSRVNVLESFLGDFLGSLASGLGAAHGPGAFGKGFAAAATEPYQQDLQRFQMQQQANLNEAEVQQRQAQAQMTQQQAAFLPTQQGMQMQAGTAQPRWDPNTREFIGTMTDSAFANYVKGQGAAKQNALSKQAQADLQAGKVAKYLPTPDGRYLALDSKGNPLHVVDGAIDPQMMQKYSNTQKLVPDGAGGFLVVPTTTTSGVALTPYQQVQKKVPALAQNQTQQQQVQQKVPALANTASGPRHIYGNGPVFAFDPATNQQVLSTPSEVAAKGFQNPVKVTPGDIEKEKSASAMISDVQLNKSRYSAAMNQVYGEPVTAKQATALAALTPEKLGIDIGHGFGLSLPDVIQKVTNATAFSDLSNAQKKAMVGYYSTLASVPGYQKALTQIGRANKEMMDLELRTVPTPLMDKETFGIMLDRFQGNIDQVGQRTIRFPGIPTVQDVRRQYEGQQQELPADVQQLLSTKWTNR